MPADPINPFNNSVNPFKALQSNNKARLAKYLATKDMAEYQKLQEKKTDAELKITSFNTLLNNLSIMNSALDRLKRSLSGLKTAMSSDNSYITATPTAFTSAGNYNIQIASIAQAQRLVSSIFASPNSSVADLSVYSTQQLRLQIGSKAPVVITIDGSNNSLEAIRDAINNAQSDIKADLATFDVTDQNNKIKFKVGGSTYTAVIEEGNYSAQELSHKLKMAFINAYGLGGDKFNVSYDEGNDRFKITNNTGYEMELLWEDSGSTARAMLGFDEANQTLQNGNTLTAQNDPEITGYRLTLTSSETGANNKITISVDIDNDGQFGVSAEETANAGLARLAFDATYDASNNVVGGITNMTQTQRAQNAVVKFNGQEYTRTKNNITDIVPGLTINLLRADPNYNTDPKTFRLSVYPMGIEANLKTLVSAYNITADVIERQRGTISEPGVLSNDSMLNQLDSDIRGFFNRNGSLLTDLGLRFTPKGRLEFDEVSLKTKISENASSVTTSMGMMSSRLSIKLSNYIDTDIPRHQASYEDSIKDIQRQEQRVKGRLKVKQLMITNQENPLNELLNQPPNREGGLLSLLSSSTKKKK